MFADLGVYMLKIEGFVYISYLDYPGAKSYAYSGYDTLEYKTASQKSGISAVIKHSEKAIGYPSLLSKEAGRYNGRRNADKLIPGEVLPPCVETESRFLIKNGVLMQYLGHEEEVTIPDTCTALEQIELTKGLKKIGRDTFSETALTHIDLPDGLTGME